MLRFLASDAVLLNALDRMQTFDRMLSEMEMTEFNGFEEENRALESVGKPYSKNLNLLPDLEEHRVYSDVFEIQ